MIKIALCSFEKMPLNKMEDMLIEVARKNAIQLDIEVFFSGERLEMSILGESHYDLAFLVIQMKGNVSLTTVSNIRRMDENLLMVAVSAQDECVMNLLKLGAFDFIKQPIQTDIFNRTFMAAYQKICSRKVYYTFHYKNEVHKILSSEIQYFKSNGRQIQITLKDGRTKCFNGKLNDIERYISGGETPFLRTHQSFLVNYHWIQTSSRTQVTLSDGTNLPISEERQKSFQGEFLKLLGAGFSKWIG